MSNTTCLDRFWAKVDVRGPEDCWEWQGSRNKVKGYGVMGTSYENRAKASITAHRYSFLIHYGPIPSGWMVCHTCDNPPCVNPAHLWAGTNSDNQADSWRKGRRVTNAWKMRVARQTGRSRTVATGWRHPRRSLSDQQVKDIKTRLAAGHKQLHIARDFGVGQPVICRIAHGFTYRDVAA